MLVAMALIWGYSFLTMKTVLDTVPTFMLLACRFLLSAVIMFIIFRKRIKAHFIQASTWGLACSWVT